MAMGKTHLLDRFPMFQALIHHLFDSNQNFNDLCRQYGDMNQRISTLDGTEDPAAHEQAMTLKRRRDSVEQELRAMMEQNARV